MAWIATSVLVYGTVEQKKANERQERALKQSAEDAKKAGEFQAVQLERKAGETRAAGHVEAREAERQGDLIMSRAKTVAGASGAAGADFSDLEAEQEYRILMNLFNSELSARDQEVAAEVARTEGADAARSYEASASAARSQGRANLFLGLGQIGVSLYDRFGNRNNRGQNPRG